jgi:hypothetical protein
MKKTLTLQTLLLATALALGGCAATNYGDEQLKLGMATAGKDIMWVPSKIDIVHKMLDAAQVKPSDIVYDLGLVYGRMGNEAKSLDCMKEIYEVDYGYRDVAARVESSYSS